MIGAPCSVTVDGVAVIDIVSVAVVENEGEVGSGLSSILLTEEGGL